MISDRAATATAYSLDNLQKRGELFIGARDDVYEGMIIGENSRTPQLPGNPTRPKQLINVRTVNVDEAINLRPHSLKRALSDARTRRSLTWL